MRWAYYILIIVIMVVVLVASVYSLADSNRELVEQGNLVFADADYEQALEAYEKARVDMPESSELYFNIANVYYSQEDYKQASDYYKKAAEKATDPVFEAQCWWKLGNCVFQEAQRQQDSDLKKTIELLQESVTYYQKAFELDENFTDSAHNIEVSRLLIKVLLDKMKDQESDYEVAKTLQELIKRQAEAIDKNKAIEQLRNNPNNEERIKEESHSLNDQQNEINQDTQALSEKVAASIEQSGGQVPETTQQMFEHINNAITEQAIASEKLNQSQLEEALPDQQKSRDELQAALDAIPKEEQEQQQQEKEGEDQQGEEDEQKKEGEEKKEGEQSQTEQSPTEQSQADKDKEDEEQKADAKAILDEEKENKEKRRKARKAGHTPVDKDW